MDSSEVLLLRGSVCSAGQKGERKARSGKSAICKPSKSQKDPHRDSASRGIREKEGTSDAVREESNAAVTGPSDGGAVRLEQQTEISADVRDRRSSAGREQPSSAQPSGDAASRDQAEASLPNKQKSADQHQEPFVSREQKSAQSHSDRQKPSAASPSQSPADEPKCRCAAKIFCCSTGQACSHFEQGQVERGCHLPRTFSWQVEIQ